MGIYYRLKIVAETIHIVSIRFQDRSPTAGNRLIFLFIILPWLFGSGILIPLCAAFSSDHNSSEIDTIVVVGNRITQHSVILHEIELAPGKIADSHAIKRDKLRLESLGLFSRVDITVREENGQNQLVIAVVELWYIWPGIYLSIDKDRPTEKIDYGLLVSHLNFRGRGEDFSIIGWGGSSRGGKIKWSIPYLRGKREWFARMQGKGNIEEDPASITGRHGVETEDLNLEGEFGRRFGLTTRLWLKCGAKMRTFNWDISNTNGQNNTIFSDEHDYLATMSFNFSHDTRYYRPWPRQGEMYKASLQLEKSVDDDRTMYVLPSASVAAYRSLSRLFILAGMVEAGTCIGDIPWYRNFLLDRHNGIRTPLEDEFEGIYFTGLKGELRGDLLPITYLTFRTFKPLNNYTHDLKFGISYALFSDFRTVGGEIENPFDPEVTEKEGWDVAYGAGIIFHIPYREIIRVEYSRSARFPELGYILKLRIGPLF